MKSMTQQFHFGNFNFKRPGMAPKKAHFISLFLTIILWVCTDYLFLPAYNLHDAGFIVYIFFLLGVFTILDTLLSLRFTKVNKTCALILVIIAVLFFCASVFKQ